MQTNPRLLIADDDALIHSSIELIAENLGWKLTHASTAAQTLEKAKSDTFDCIILDIHLGSDKAGIEVLKKLKTLATKTPVIVLSGEDNFDIIKEALKLGAEDYIIKGNDAEKLTHSIQLVLKTKFLEDQKRLQQSELLHRDQAHMLIGSSATIQELRKTIAKLKNKKFNVLITGETGTGKEIVARQLRAQDPEGDLEPFVAIDSATILSSTAESTLFGHEKGAFTGAEQQKIGLFEEAKNGTVYFDEISNMPIEIQSKLMRVLQEKEIRRLGSSQTIKLDFRVVAATNRDLNELSKKGTFKDDLYQRLNVVPILVPPLRERTEDIKELLEYSFKKAGAANMRVSEDAITLLKSYPWPGNVRELVHLVHYWIAMCDSETIEASDLPPHIRVGSNLSSSGSFYERVEAFEAKILKEEYQKCDGNISALAETLGMDRSHLYSKLAQYEIHKKRDKVKTNS